VDPCFCRSAIVRFVIVPLALLFSLPVARSQAVPLTLPEAPRPTTSALPDPGRIEQIDVSWRKLPKRVLREQKDIWLFPAQLARGHYLLPTFLVVGTTAGLMAADPPAMPYFRGHAENLDDVNDVFDTHITSAATIVAPLSLLVVGYTRHDTYAVKTSLLAGEAYLNGAIVDLALKGITQRNRPSGVAPGAPFSDTFFRGGSSFPSGHATGAFAVATVIAKRYRTRRWVPWAAYGLATAISLSRVSTSNHFPSDIFVGAVLGYTIARFDVLR
jgi:membrane-associated phospholipid phosphatase